MEKEQPHDILMVDLYIDYKLVKKDDRMPLYYTKTTEGRRVDLVAAARDRLAGTCKATVSFYMRPREVKSEVIDVGAWRSEETRFVSIEEVDRLKKQYVAILFNMPVLPDPLTKEEKAKLPRVYPACKDDVLVVTLFTNGALFKKNYPIPIRYVYNGNFSTIDLAMAVRQAFGVAQAKIQIWDINKGYNRGFAWKQQDAYDNYPLNCAQVRRMIEEKDVSINVIFVSSPPPQKKTVVDYCQNGGVLTVDIFLNGRPLIRNEQLPLETSLREEMFVRVDLLASVRKRVPGMDVLSLRIFTVKLGLEKTTPIVWRSLRDGYVFNCETLRKLTDGKYVALNLVARAKKLQEFYPGCLICGLDAHLVDKRVMETFCSSSCHQLFLSEADQEEEEEEEDL